MFEGGGWYVVVLLLFAVVWLVFLAARANRLGVLRALLWHGLVGMGLSAAFVAPIESPEDVSGLALFQAKIGTWLDQGGMVFVAIWLAAGLIAFAIGKRRSGVTVQSD